MYHLSSQISNEGIVKVEHIPFSIDGKNAPTPALTYLLPNLKNFKKASSGGDTYGFAMILWEISNAVVKGD